jgi:Ca2+/Na+ antiporter
MYLIGKRLFNRAVAYLGLIILVTTIPFYNFAVQIRGYSLSMTLVIMVLYYVWNFERTLRWRHAVGAILCAVLALYTIPRPVQVK